MTAINRREAREQARKAVNKWAMGLAATAWVPGSHYVMAAGDITFVIQIGSIYKVDLDRTSAGALFTTVAAPLIGSKVAHTVLDFVPLGSVIKSVVAGVVTKSVGEAMIQYFEDCSPLPA
jgi:uncharacterized protein (DUF697 family)